MEGDKVRSWTAERLGTPHIRKRAPRRADVIFAVGYSDRGGRDLVARERRKVGFKALPDAEDVKRRIEEWIDSELRRAAEEVAEFVESERSTTGSDEAPRARRVENPLLGLRIDFPTEWNVEVRHKKKPQGKFFFDNQDWRSLRDGDHWNLIKIEGPARCLIEVEAFETEPTVTFDKLAHSRVADATAGKVVESDPDYELNGLRGFFVTRRNELQVDLDVNRANVAAVVAPERLAVLHDGRRQVCVVSTWPEDSPDLKRAVDSVVESIAIY